VELALSGAEGVEGEVVQAQLLNVNADTAAGEIAAALPADRLVFLTDVAGVLDASGALRLALDAQQARALLDEGTIVGGMIPKVEAGLRAAAVGVQTVIADGRAEGALRSILDDGGAFGTRIG
jgi:acetylglutamate kinase